MWERPLIEQVLIPESKGKKGEKVMQEIKRVSEIELDDIIREPDNNPAVPVKVSDSAVMESRELTDDDICIAIREDEIPDTVLKAVLYGLAEEQASLKNLRVEKTNEKKDTSFISLKRGTLLKFMSETLIQRQALVGATSDIDLRGPKFREVFKMILGIINSTFDEVKIPPEYKEMFFHALSRNMEGWEERAEKIIKAMTPKV
jgi:hypothetical protein